MKKHTPQASDDRIVLLMNRLRNLRAADLDLVEKVVDHLEGNDGEDTPPVTIAKGSGVIQIARSITVTAPLLVTKKK